MSAERRGWSVRRWRHVPVLVATAMVASVGLLAPTPAAAAVDPCGPQGNAITCENSKPGTPSREWDINGAGDTSIQGFATDISVAAGTRIDFKIDTDASAYTIDIYRIGYYDGDGARKIDSVAPSATLPQHQPSCITEKPTELYDCGNWKVSASWDVPAWAVSGVYIARLHRADTDGSSHITFIVRDDDSRSDVVFQTSDTTWQAYNTYGGSDFYQGAANGRAYQISYNRPVLTRGGIGGRDFFFANEYPMVRFLEKNGYDTTYIAGVDTDRFGERLTNHKVFLSVGHDEYWSKAQRANVTAARDAGVNLQFLSGNEMYWKIRYESSADESATPYRTITSYKETWANDKIDPSTEWTGTWRDPRFAPRSAGGGSPENALIGTMYMVNHDDLAVQVKAAEGRYRLWRHTSLASLAPGSTATLAPHTVGYESNEDIDNGFRPPGLVRLSTTRGEVPEYLQDFGNTVAAGQTTHHLTLYRAASKALVFSAGSVQWTWGLDSEHDSPFSPEPADRRMQQAQVNLFADMGVQPATLDPALTATPTSADTSGPAVTITSPAAGAATPNGSAVTVTGTAADVGGGQVAGVEVSTDGGASWRPATGTTSWSYTYVQRGEGSVPIKVRAVDDGANIGAAVTRELAVSCPCSVFGSQVPATATTDDRSPVELGQRITVERDGFLTGVRFYKGANNTGTHTGSLWSTAGERLATGTFANETSTGWQTMTFASPVAVSAGETVIASYSAPSGGYAVEYHQVAYHGIDAGPLSVEGGHGAPPAGVYGPIGTFPDQSWNGGGYFVDAVYSAVDDSPLTAGGQWPLAGSSSVPTDTTIRAKLSRPATGVDLGLKDARGDAVPGTTRYDPSTRVVTFTPSHDLSGFVTYTATVTATDSQGQPVSEGATWSFTTVKPDPAAGVCPCSLFSDSTVPAVMEVADTAAVTLGVRFAAARNGVITGVRFYKGPNNTGTHTGALWAANGSKLAEGTFTDESTSGWQTLVFDEPVPITKDTEYVASYRTSVGQYSATIAGFPVSKGPLQATSGAYTYGSGFPDGGSSTNYLVDVVFETPAPTLAIAGQDPAPGALGVDRRAAVHVDFTAPIDAGAVSLAVGGEPVAGTSQRSSDGTRIVFTPAAPLPVDTLVTARLTGVTGSAGGSVPDSSWTFRTAVNEIDGATQTLFGDEVPEVASVDDGSPVEVGVAFTPARRGKVTGIRFFKGPGNGGTHVGSLWSEDGSRLATVTFGNESASGWQTARLSSPVSLSAGRTYVVSYVAPQGHYAASSGYFERQRVTGDLSAPAVTNGRYRYGDGGVPAYTWNATNYFVDVMFVADPPSVDVVDKSPTANAVGVDSDVHPSITFDQPVVATTQLAVSANGSPVAGTVSRSEGGRTLTFTPAANLPPGASVTVGVTGIATADGATMPDVSWTFTVGLATTPGQTLFGGLVPAQASTDDGDPVEVGTAFRVSQAAEALAVRFYKGAGNTGTHTGSLWTAGGELLARVVFSGETATGWQRAFFDAPVALSPGTTYVVSYHAPNGHYAATPEYFAQARTSGILTAPAGDNGRYRYGVAGTFPTGSWNATNYFVDVVVRPTGS